MINQCGDCTLCCMLLPVKWMDKPAGEDCVHCDGGCLIHETKPAECSDFECSWLQSNVDNDELRPDRCGVVFEKVDDTEFYGNVVPGGKVTEMALSQMRNFIAQGYTVRLSEQV